MGNYIVYLKLCKENKNKNNIAEQKTRQHFPKDISAGESRAEHFCLVSSAYGFTDRESFFQKRLELIELHLRSGVAKSLRGISMGFNKERVYTRGYS